MSACETLFLLFDKLINYNKQQNSNYHLSNYNHV